MDWHTWLASAGVTIPNSPDVESLVVAVVLVAGAVAIGWFAGHRAAPPVAVRLKRLGGRAAAFPETFVAAVIQYSVIALLLLIVGNSVALSPLALMLLAVALGIAVARLVHRIARAAGLGKSTATILALVALVATTAATLGGMQPLIHGLDEIGVTIGKHRITLLAVINAIVIVALLYVVAKAANHVLVHLIGRTSSLDLSQRALVQKLAGIGVVVVAVLLGIDLLGIDLTALTVFSGAAGLAIGFGLQKTFGNLIAGLILLMDRSIKPGDVIVVGDTFGSVGKIGVRAGSVVTRDGKEHLIPNEQLMTDAVENWSYSDRNVRIHIPVGVAYGCDLAKAQQLMVEAATGAARVLDTPKPSVWLKDFSDSSVDHDILVWIADPELGVGNVRSDILNRLWRLFADNDIELPFPQRDIHVRSMPPPPATG
ncbi:mechanosensitive ion channel family protein [Sphingomonas sp. 10B4]|uniref:mechanosensitive ion channel family protein n=1 Tax=Sphingomonas sp. 10B4 TaxID=3048575 RepID=UPI002AB5871A|nr:mechanosensitive ion channel domain-containing protein [Sphingomonas sp. 10B4]MDY7524620.1 mechanosensitive ion channel [Sphingomonas sp. 10B4]MEB0282423.1 mechanosensitive ion channel [Sphingomonas sp. 10B4]